MIVNKFSEVFIILISPVFQGRRWAIAIKWKGRMIFLTKFK